MMRQYLFSRTAERFWGWLPGLVVATMVAMSTGCGGSSDSGSTPPPSGNFIVCSSTYALCTSSVCEPVPGNDQEVSCPCPVQTGYSVGLTDCQDVVVTPDGQKEILSRYFPAKSYAICNNDRPWAACLDSTCVIDPNDPTQATCTCPLAKDMGKYVVIHADGMYDSSVCTTGIVSSAPLKNAKALTEYLRTHKTPLKPFKIKVFRPH